MPTTEGLTLTTQSVRSSFLGLVSTAVLLLAGCAESGVPESAPYNEADLNFVQQMIPHHEQAVEISNLAEERSASAEITSLASDIGFIQSIELEELHGWLLAWGIAKDSDGHEGHTDMAGMISESDLEALSSAADGAFDLLWAQLMIKHHEGAISAAKSVISDGKSADLKFFAESIVETQSAELEELRGIVSSLSPESD